MFIRSDKSRQALMVLAALVSAMYLAYRAFFSLNLEGVYATAASVSLLLAEGYGCFLMLLYFFSIWKIVEPEQVPPLENRSVDVYIPTYNEEPDLLRGTISAALALDYPHETYVLDDGDRPAVKELTERLGAHYIARGYNTHAKAGNLNHAMRITKGEFLVIFDADHIAQRNFITRTLGYFADERMGFVQTPHSFYNFDNFHGTLDYEKNIYWEEGQLFYNVIQAGKNYWNGVSFCGSAAIFRRSALDAVGGVATETITEDMQTGLRMHAKGWKSLFVNERLISGQAATDVTTFNTQRLRWGEGNLSIFAYDNPLTEPGLTWGQRLCYLGSMLSWTTGVQKLMLYIAPMLMLLTGVAPIRELTWTLGLITLGYLLTIWTTVHVVSNGYGNFLGTELTHMASFWTQIKATYRALFKRRFAKFVVTSKSGRQSNRLIGYIAPQCLYVAGSALAIAWAGTRFWLGFSDDLLGFLIGSLLLLIQGWFAWLVICRALRTSEIRAAWRHPVAVHVAYRATTSAGEVIQGEAVTSDLNESGTAIVAFQDWKDADSVELKFSVGGRHATCQARVRMRSKIAAQTQSCGIPTEAWRYGLEYDQPDEAALATFWWMAAIYGVNRQYDQFLRRLRKDASGSIHHRLLTDFADYDQADLPIRLQSAFEEENTADHSVGLSVVTECVNHESTAVLLEQPCSEDAVFQFSIETPFGRISGDCQASSCTEVQLTGQSFWLQELRFLRFDAECQSRLVALLHGDSDQEVVQALRMAPKEKALPILRPSALVSGTTAAAALIAIALNVWLLRDDLLLARAYANGKATIVEVQQLEQMAQRIIQDVAPDEDRVLRLREVMRRVGHLRGVRTLDTYLATADFKGFYGRLATAQVLDEMQRHEEAANILEDLMKHRDRITDPNNLSILLIAAARTQVHLGQHEAASELFEELRAVANPERYYGEYAGVLAQAGVHEEAIALLREYGSTRTDRLLLASIYSSIDQYDNAMQVYLEMLGDNPTDYEVMVVLADNAAWDGRFVLAKTTYQQLLSIESRDTKLQEKYAQACLWAKDYDGALEHLEPLLSANLARRDLWTPYLQAATGVERLTETQTVLIASLYQQRELLIGDPTFLRNLADAMSRLNRQDEVLTLLQQVVAESPANLSLRLRLADAWRENGSYEQADAIYLDLLHETHSAQLQPNRMPRPMKVSVDTLETSH